MEKQRYSPESGRAGLGLDVEAAQRLFLESVEQYRNEVSPDADDNRIAKALSDVIEAWRSVCAAENDLIAGAGTPHGREHVLEHLSLTASLSNIAFQFSQGERSRRLLDLPFYIKDWFAEHRSRYDRWTARTRKGRTSADALNLSRT